MTGGKSLPGEAITWPPLPLMRNERVIEAPAERTLLTRRYTEQAIEFISAHRAEPFFVYLPHAMPGSTEAPFSSERFRGKSANGAYGDSVEELDWSTGEILAALQRLGLDDETLVVWTSDNGAPRRQPPQGSNAPLGGWGYTTAEGGQRVPCVVRWPGRVPAGVTRDVVATTMDVLPTFAHLAGVELPERTIDGKNIWPVVAGESEEPVHEAFYYYFGPQLQAVRSGKWKLALPLEEKWVSFGGKTEVSAGALYDVVGDPGETTDLSGEHPEVVRRLAVLAEEAQVELGDVGRAGAGQRLLGRVGEVRPQVR
jgi:arylsulfatase A-like enzyme